MIADSHPTALAGVRQTLEADGIVVCAETSDATTTVAAATRERPDVCLLADYLPGGGLAAAGRIVRDLPGTAVVMLTGAPDEEDLFAALRIGASGYLLKDMDPDRLTAALRGVVHGEAAIPRYLVTRLVTRFRDKGRQRLPVPGQDRAVELSPRESQVAHLLREGYSTKAIAERLALSPVTVRRHVSRLLEKLEVADRQAAVRLLGRPELQPHLEPGSGDHGLA